MERQPTKHGLSSLLVIYVFIKMSFRTIDLVLVGRKRES